MDKVSWRHPDPRADGATAYQSCGLEAVRLRCLASAGRAAASAPGSDPGANELLQRLSLRAEVVGVQELGYP
jgi:hypothetical protein